MRGFGLREFTGTKLACRVRVCFGHWLVLDGWSELEGRSKE
jgi:hypothetical protein